MKNKSELLINSEIFTDKVLNAAVQAYSELADIQIEQQQQDWCITFQNCRYDAELTKHEFSNYLIDLSSVSL